MMSSSQEHPLDIDEVQHASNILQRLDSMRKEEKNCDLVISAEGKKLYVNRDVMCAASDYFDAMFSHDMKEKQKGIVEMKEVQYYAVKKCVDFIYTGKIAVSESECEGLLYCASLMQLNDICSKISPFLEKHLNVKTFFATRRIAIKFSLKDLNQVCDKFALDRFALLAKEEEFNEIDLDYLSYLLSSKDSSLANMEDVKLGIALQWVRKKFEHREKDLVRILHLLDMKKISAGYCRYLVDEEPLCKTSVDFVRMLFAGKLANEPAVCTGASNYSIDSLLDSASPPNSLILFDESSKLLQVYKPLDNQLFQLTSYHADMTGRFTTCVIGSDLFVFTKHNKVFTMNITIKNATWARLPDMLHEHVKTFRCAVHESTIYVGGSGFLERFDRKKKGKWNDIDLNGNICNYSALACYKGFIYVIGGSKDGATKNVAKYCPFSLSWSRVASMNVPRVNPAATVFDSKLYAAGGYDKGFLKDFEMYDIASNLWTILASMNTPRSPLGLCIVDEQIFAVGSDWEACSMEAYDFCEKKWKKKNSPTMKIWALATVSACIDAKRH